MRIFKLFEELYTDCKEKIEPALNFAVAMVFILWMFGMSFYKILWLYLSIIVLVVFFILLFSSFVAALYAIEYADKAIEKIKKSATKND